MKHAFSKKLLALTLIAVLALLSALILTPAAEEDEAAYITAGMVAWYDGVDNEANGTHNNEATVWQNKINPTEEWAIALTPDADDHFTDEGFTVHDGRQFFPRSVVDVINGEAWTLEVSLGDFIGLGGAYHTFINCDNDNFSLFIRVDTGCLEFKYAGLTRDHRYEIPDGVELIKNSTVTITYEPGGEMVTYVDGEEMDRRDVYNLMGADNLFFGHNKTDRNQDTTFKSIRIYDRVLTPDEVAYNQSVTDGTAEGPYEAPTEAPAQYTVSFEISDPGNYYSDPAPVTVTEGECVAEPVIDRVEDGSHFDAWYTSPERTADSKFDFSTPITGDLTLYAARIPATEPETVPVTEPESETYYISNHVTLPEASSDATEPNTDDDYRPSYYGCSNTISCVFMMAVPAVGVVLFVKRRED